MNVYTVQMGKYRLAIEKGIPFVDITVRSGIQAFAPTWPMVNRWKQNKISEDDYAALYRHKVLSEKWAFESDWKELLEYDTVALACYCKAHHFCHRLLLVDILRDIHRNENRPFDYLGELE